MLYDRKKQYMISQIERQAGVKFERVSAPQPGEVAKATGSTATESIMSVSDSMLPIFRQSTKEMVKKGDL
jgi:ATP-dependent RNA helicase DDX21